MAQHYQAIQDNARTMTKAALTALLDELQREQLADLNPAISALKCVPSSRLGSVAQHEFFGRLRSPLISVLDGWHRGSHLNEDEIFTFRNVTTFLGLLFRHIDSYPSWLSDSALLEAIGVCLTDISRTEKLFLDENKRESKNFTRLMNIYSDYQESLNDNNDVERLVQLLDPIVHCLSSTHFCDLVGNMKSNRKSMSKQEKFFLIKCPAFLTAYTGRKIRSSLLERLLLSFQGSRRDKAMNELLVTMLPQYEQLLNRLMPSREQWSRPMIRAVNQIFRIVNHGLSDSTDNPKLLNDRLPLIDHALTLIDTSKFYGQVRKGPINVETSLVSTIVTFLDNLIHEPVLLEHIKAKQITTALLRLTESQCQPLVYNLLAFTTNEESIKAMKNPGILLSKVVKSLKEAMAKGVDERNRTPELLEALKGNPFDVGEQDDHLLLARSRSTRADQR